MPMVIKLRLKKVYCRLQAKINGFHQTTFNPKYSIEPLLNSHQLDQVADVFVWAVIDWHFRIQRPQHMARQFAELSHRVFYFSNDFIDDPKPGFKVEKLADNLELYCIRLHVTGSLAIYYGRAPAAALQQLKASMQCFYQWSKTRCAYSIIQHPFWLDLVECLPNQTLIYDCMDHHGGFEDNVPAVLNLEEKLIQQTDRLVVTSAWLYQTLITKNQRIALIRNACDFNHFSIKPKQQFQDPQLRKIIGYYGAIAEWFDVKLVEKIAGYFPDCLILLVGNDTVKANNTFAKHANILMTGEVNYQTLPSYLYAMDVCLIPFKVIPLTLATNPVKAYEYLCAGKPVVAVDLPELHEFEQTIFLANSHEAFIATLKKVLGALNDADEQETKRRIDFSKNQTWHHRVTLMKDMLQAATYPLISIIMVTYNNLGCTKACLESIELFTDYPNFEVIIVDNNSRDGSQDFLRYYVELKANYSLIINDNNSGFSAANNQGLQMARGDYLVLLNNDTYVTSGWLASLYRHFKRNPLLGMVGPSTNNIGNEAKITIHYHDMTEMAQKAQVITLSKMGESFSIPALAFFCVMLSRKVYEQVGELDEAFGIGMFEDDDYCRRVTELGYEMLCADDVFIHHHLSASFDQMGVKRKQQLFEKNKLIYEKKWGAWIPHKYRNALQ